MVRPYEKAHEKKGEGVDLLVHVNGEDYQDLHAMSGGRPGLAIQQIVTAHLAMRRFEALQRGINDVSPERRASRHGAAREGECVADVTFRENEAVVAPHGSAW